VTNFSIITLARSLLTSIGRALAPYSQAMGDDSIRRHRSGRGFLQENRLVP
jgi:hypothetical protein